MKTKRQLPIWIITFLFALSIGGCEDDIPYNNWEYQMNLATYRALPSPAFILDNGIELLPAGTLPTKTVLSDNDRVLLLYEYTDNQKQNNTQRKINVNSYARTNLDTIHPIPGTELSEVPDDPLFLTSIWQEGDYVNIRFSVEINQKQHFIRMYYTPGITNDTLNLELRHDKSGDTPGYLEPGYFSFDIKKQKPHFRAVSIRMNTSNYGGIRSYAFPLLNNP